MAHTFDIRFARSGGLAGFIASSENSFGWKGNGRLSIDSAGMNFAVSRNLVTWMARSRAHRIPAEDITDVYREGDALRVEFATAQSTRAVLPFWAHDRETAAQIVQLLPTSRTVEIEDMPAQPGENHASNYLRISVALLLIVACAVMFVAFKRTAMPPLEAEDSSSAPLVTPEITPAVEAPPAETAVPAVVATTLEAPDEPASPRAAVDDPSVTAVPRERPARRPATPPPATAAEAEPEDFVPSLPEIRLRGEDLVIPIEQRTVAYDVGRGLLARFEAGAEELSAGYRQQRELMDSGRLTREEFAASLDSYREKWRDLARRLLDTVEARNPALTGLRATLLSVATHQGTFLEKYAAGLRIADAQLIETSFEELALADQALERARLYVR